MNKISRTQTKQLSQIHNVSEKREITR